jgi:hypothetical protein
MGQVIEAFMAANDVDSSVPFLRPAHHEHLVRRLSLLPAPPLPQALSKAGKAAAGTTRSKITISNLQVPERLSPETKRQTVVQQQEPNEPVDGLGGAAFHGLLGKRK